MIHWRSDHRFVTAHFRFPCVKKKGGLNNKDRKQHLCKNTRYTRQSASMETRKDPEPSDRSKKSTEDMMTLKRGWFTGKHEAAAAADGDAENT